MRYLNLSVVIRQAKPGEEALLAAIISRSFRDVADRFNLTPENCPTHPSSYSGERVQRDLEKGIAYHLAEAGGRPIGCVALERADADTFYLERLAVLPESRRQGVGQVLVRHALRSAAEAGAKRVGIAIVAAQDELRQWYENQGFLPGETKRYPHLPFAVLFMSCDIGKGVDTPNKER